MREAVGKNRCIPMNEGCYDPNLMVSGTRCFNLATSNHHVLVQGRLLACKVRGSLRVYVQTPIRHAATPDMPTIHLLSPSKDRFMTPGLLDI